MAAPSVSGQSERQNPVHVLGSTSSGRAEPSVAPGPAGALRTRVKAGMWIPRMWMAPAIAPAKQHRALKHDLDPPSSDLQPAQQLSRLFYQNCLKTELRTDLVPSNRCSVCCFSPLKASLHPSTATSAKHVGMEAKQWEQSQCWNPDIPLQVSDTLTKLFFVILQQQQELWVYPTSGAGRSWACLSSSAPTRSVSSLQPWFRIKEHPVRNQQSLSSWGCMKLYKECDSRSSNHAAQGTRLSALPSSIHSSQGIIPGNSTQMPFRSV